MHTKASATAICPAVLTRECALYKATQDGLILRPSVSSAPRVDHLDPEPSLNKILGRKIYFQDDVGSDVNHEELVEKNNNNNRWMSNGILLQVWLQLRVYSDWNLCFPCKQVPAHLHSISETGWKKLRHCDRSHSRLSINRLKPLLLFLSLLLLALQQTNSFHDVRLAQLKASLPLFSSAPLCPPKDRMEGDSLPPPAGEMGNFFPAVGVLRGALNLF